MNRNLKRIRGTSLVHGRSFLTHEEAVRRAGGKPALDERLTEGSVVCYRVGHRRRYDFDIDIEPAPVAETAKPHEDDEGPTRDDLHATRRAIRSACDRLAEERGKPFDPAWPLIYVIQCGEGGAFKIGRSGSFPAFRRRLHHMQVGSPELLIVRRFLRGREPLERQLHKRFRPLAIRGEWFRKTDELEDFAAGIEEDE